MSYRAGGVAGRVWFSAILLGLTGAGMLPYSSLGGDKQPTDMFLGLTPSASKGYEILLGEAMAAPIMKEKDIDRIWMVWEEEERAKAEKADPTERRRLTFERYGWATRPGEDASGLPLDYTADGKGNLVSNCFSCHGGKVAGVTIPGAGNTLIDLTTLSTDVVRLRALDNNKDPSQIPDQIAPFKTPLNFHRGVTNAVIFAPVFAGLRDLKLGINTRNIRSCYCIMT
ncbi:MAG: hypothetical protein U1D30_15740 [Planctomycetota bacterium]